MDFTRFDNLYRENIPLINSFSKSSIESFMENFRIAFTHNSTAIEGNTLTLQETAAVIKDGITIAGKRLRELYEVDNHYKAFLYIEKMISENKVLDENIVKEIHNIVMTNIIVGDIYRNEPVWITGSQHIPPVGNDMFYQLKTFYTDMPEKRKSLHPIEFAAWTHAEFVKIHPFIDGNGRTSRLLMNYQLMSFGLFPVNIEKTIRPAYYTALENYAVENDIKPFASIIEKLEISQIQTFAELYKNSCDFEPSEVNNDFDDEMEM